MRLAEARPATRSEAPAFPAAPPTAENVCSVFAATVALKRLKPMWTTPILTVLLEGPMRFNELQRALAPVSAKVLAARLVAMAADGLVWREERVTEPPKEVVYALTEHGRAVRGALDALAEWTASRAAHDGRPDG